MTDQPNNQRQRNVRFKPDEGTYALLELATASDYSEHPIPALVLNESYKGCSLVLLNNDAIEVGTKLTARVGKLAPMKSEVRWRVQLDDQVIKIGLLFLE